MKANALFTLWAATALITVVPGKASAHCDTMDGPVISAARQALDTGNINLALVWVQPSDEAAIQSAFDQARAGRTAGGAEREKAERRFFEAFVRIHRAGEGAPYTGIKPAGAAIDPGVRAADRSLEAGSVSEVQQLLTDAVQSGLQRKFQTALKLRDYGANDVGAGRDYVKAYVTYTHFVEGIHQAVTASASQHVEGGQHAAHAAGHIGDHGGHSEHADHAAHLPWIIVVVLGLGLVGETVFLVTRRKATVA